MFLDLEKTCIISLSGLKKDVHKYSIVASLAIMPPPKKGIKF